MFIKDDGSAPPYFLNMGIRMVIYWPFWHSLNLYPFILLLLVQGVDMDDSNDILQVFANYYRDLYVPNETVNKAALSTCLSTIDLPELFDADQELDSLPSEWYGMYGEFLAL